MASDDEEQDNVYIGGARGSVLLIDVSPSMWTDIEDERPIDIALNTSLALIQKMMIEANKQLIGTCFFGCKDKNGSGNVIQITELSEPAVQEMLKLKKYTENPEVIERELGTTDNFNLADALWQAGRMFSACKKSMNSQAIIVLSCLGEPKQNDHRSILKRATDIRELDISINLINISNKKLPPNSFYEELGAVISTNTNIPWEMPEPVMDMKSIMTLVWSNYKNIAATAKLKMYLGEDLAISVGLYRLCRKQTKPKKQLLHRETNEIVVTQNRMQIVGSDNGTTIDRDINGDDESQDLDNDLPESQKDTSGSILRSDIVYYQNHGGKNIEFSSVEHYELRKFAGNPCIKLLGFKPMSILNMPEWYFEPSSFLYVNEQEIEGSTKLFLALRDRCLALQRIPICLLVARWFAKSRLVALFPQKRIMNGSRQIQPDGFHVIYLPYSDNFKEVPLEKPADITAEQKDCMQSIVNKLKFLYNKDMFENPDLQTFYKAIEALALNDTDSSEVDDTTLPDMEQQGERLESLQENFDTIFGSMGPTSVKRTNNEDRPSKKVAVEPREALDGRMLIARIENQKVQSYTVAQLKDILKIVDEAKLPALTGLKKNELVQLVYQYRDNIISKANDL